MKSDSVLGVFANFNSIKVQLELCTNLTDVFLFHNFNSIKVQLEQGNSGTGNSSGAFQFHKGTIRTFSEKVLKLTTSYFNSIKVQLEPIIA